MGKFFDGFLEMLRTSNDEQGIELCTKLLNPTNRVEMGEVYNKTLGYDPTVKFDFDEITEKLSNFVKDNEIDASKVNIPRVADVAMDLYIEGREEAQNDAIHKALAEVVGQEIADEFGEWTWGSSPTDEDDSVEDDFDDDDDLDDDEIDEDEFNPDDDDE